MDNGQLLLILLVSFAIMVMIKIPIAYALGLSSMIVIIKMGLPLTSAINSMYSSVNNFSLLAVPLFMLLAQLMDKGGITDRLFAICDAFVGHIRGGLGHVNVLISLLFGHLSGSAQADAAGIGAMIIPAMKRAGYDSGFSVAITACSSTLGVIIPPSVLLVVYGAMSGASIGALFIAGFVPGFLIAFAQCMYTYYMAIKHNYPRGERYTWKERGKALRAALPVIFLPMIILGGTSSGLFTATESASISCFYALILMFCVYRTYKIKEDSAENSHGLFPEHVCSGCRRCYGLADRLPERTADDRRCDPGHHGLLPGRLPAPDLVPAVYRNIPEPHYSYYYFPSYYKAACSCGWYQ